MTSLGLVDDYTDVDQGLAAAQSAFAGGDVDLALELWGKLQTAYPHNATAYIRTAGTLIQRGEFDRAETLIEDALPRFPNEFTFPVFHARVAHLRGDTSQAVRRWAVVQERFPNSIPGYTGMVESLRVAGRCDEADVHAQEAMSKFPESIALRVEYARVAIGRKDYDEALRRFSEIQARFPDDPAGCRGQAFALSATGRFDEVEKLLKEATEKFPDDSGVRSDYNAIAANREAWAALHPPAESEAAPPPPPMPPDTPSSDRTVASRNIPPAGRSSGISDRPPAGLLSRLFGLRRGDDPRR